MKQCCVLLCLILLLGCLSACREPEEKTPTPSMEIVVGGETTESSSTTEMTTEATTEPTETATEPTEATLPIGDQIALMAREYASWLPAEEWYYQLYSYAVTDLNHNGRLELLVSSCQGTGIYTMTDVYEVSEDGTSLIRCENSLGEGASQADLIVSQAPVYYDEENGAYVYLFMDSMRSGWAWNGVEYRAVSLTDGVMTEKMIAGESNEWDEQGNGTTTYYNAEGEDIDETAYQSAVENYFEGWNKMEATFVWQNYNYEEAAAMDDNAWALALEESYAGFGVN